jgi:YbbR domain-containing protein
VQRLDYPQWRRTATPIALAFLSLTVAIILWVAVTDAENPNRVAVFNGAIQVEAVNVPQDLAVASIRNPTVSLRVAADSETFGKLTTADFRAEVDLSGVRETTSDQVVFARVVDEDDNVEIIEVSPAFVTVTLEPVAAKQVPVQANLIGAPPQGFSIPNDAIQTSPTQVRVSGATSLVQLVTSVGADVNLTGLRVSLEQRYPLTARDARGADIRGVLIEPPNADIRVGVAQQQVTLPVTIVPQVRGSVADGYNLVSIAPEPPAVPISGPLEALQALPFLTTEAVDVSGLRNDATRSVRLSVPAGFITTRDTVTVRFRVAPARGEISLSVAPQVTNVPEGMRAAVQTTSVALRLSGELPTLRALSPAAVRTTVNATGLAEGVHVLTPTIQAPDGIEVISADPQQVVVVLRR